MIIRKRLDIPVSYTPDVGEVVDARRSTADTWTRAVILRVRRMRGDHFKFWVYWLEDNPRAGAGDKPIAGGTEGYIRTAEGGWPPLIRQISRDQAQRPTDQ